MIPATVPEITEFPPPIASEAPSSQRRRPLSVWWTIGAAAGPLFDGGTTCWAMAQSGAAALVSEGNALFTRLFGSTMTCGEMLLFKGTQAGLLAWLAHAGRQKEGDHRAIAKFAVVTNIVTHVIVGSFNIKTGRFARRVNAAYTVAWP